MIVKSLMRKIMIILVSIFSLSTAALVEITYAQTPQGRNAETTESEIGSLLDYIQGLEMQLQELIKMINQKGEDLKSLTSQKEALKNNPSGNKQKDQQVINQLNRKIETILSQISKLEADVKRVEKDIANAQEKLRDLQNKEQKRREDRTKNQQLSPGKKILGHPPVIKKPLNQPGSLN